MDLVHDHELSGLRAQVPVGVLEPASVSRALEVEIHRLSPAPSCDLMRQRRLADLPWTEQNHGRQLPQTALHVGGQVTAN